MQIASAINLRFAKPEDCLMLFEWWNDPLTRQMMHLQDPVDFSTHVKWFESVLNSDNYIMLIGEVSDVAVNVVRFDRRSRSRWEVSLNGNPFYRGRGFGKQVLKIAIDFVFKNRSDINELCAKVRLENKPSTACFLGAGFKIIDDSKARGPGFENFMIGKQKAFISERKCDV